MEIGNRNSIRMKNFIDNINEWYFHRRVWERVSLSANEQCLDFSLFLSFKCTHKSFVLSSSLKISQQSNINSVFHTVSYVWRKMIVCACFFVHLLRDLFVLILIQKWALKFMRKINSIDSMKTCNNNIYVTGEIFFLLSLSREVVRRT